MPAPLQCPVCGDAIGVYEPLLVVGDDFIRKSSLAGEPRLRTDGEVLVHEACGAALGVDGDGHRSVGEPGSAGA